MQRRLQAYRYELIPSGEQQRQMRCYAGSRRFVFNKALALQKERLVKGEKKLSYAGLCKLLLTGVMGQRHHGSRKLLHIRYSRHSKIWSEVILIFFAKRADFPRFKKKGQGDSFRYPDNKQIKLDQGNCRIFLPKLGWMRYRKSREVLGTVKNVTVRFHNGKWFISIQTEQDVEVPTPKGDAIGIDMGIVRFATFSDSSSVEPLNSFKRHETVLRKGQQVMSRKTKYSSNWKKAKARVQRIHARIANVRNDFLHKLSTQISKNHAIICVEDLQIGNMSKSAAGTFETPGTNVRAKSGLNKPILDQGWYEFHRQLDYKQAWNGGWLIGVPPRNTSRSCPICCHVCSENRQTQAEFRCVECGFTENADIVGAVNILREGLSRIACRANEITRRQQEPTEALLAL